MDCLHCRKDCSTGADVRYAYEVCPIINSKPRTNADRIRSMSDEELAKQLAGEQYVGMKTFVLGFDRELLPVIEEETRKARSEIVKEKLDWLKQEATDG